ncbi:trimeric LpxA-like protein [Macrophomina phaseolina]|uniref:Trimeric LpxA-like protein n=1 Tax=Macrophomina phaseolina TaxID=35725 RepID=A0ABQ8GXL6_9PEZI|nr:trimeric LpxA-like protein [Macrophomina phaseolina]
MSQSNSSPSESCSSAPQESVFDQDAGEMTSRTSSVESVTRVSGSQKKRPFYPRTKSGCLNCRKRKKKCSEERPICDQCRRFGLYCDLQVDSSDTLHESPQILPRESASHMHPAHPKESYAPAGSAMNPISLEGRQGPPGYSTVATYGNNYNSMTQLTPGAPVPFMQFIPWQPTAQQRPPVTVQQHRPVTAQQGSDVPPNCSAEKTKMLSGKTYNSMDSQLILDREQCRKALWRLGSVFTETERGAILRELLGGIGRDTQIESPFVCEYGYNINIGDDVFIGPNCSIVDPAGVVIGSRCFIGPNVSIFGKRFTLNPRDRRGSRTAAYGMPVHIEDEVCIEGNVTILPGVKICRGSTVAAGSMVTKSIPPGSFAGGNPARISEYV